MRARIILALGWLAGCSVLTPPQPEPVRITLTKLPDHSPHAARRLGTIVVLPTEDSVAYSTVRMAYSERRYELAYFRDHEWAEPPSQMIHKMLLRVLEQTGAFRVILTADEGVAGSYVLHTELLQLVQDDTRAPPVLRLGLRFALRNPSGRSVASRDIALEVPMREPTPTAGVLAANDAVATALQEIADTVLRHVR